MPADQPTDQPRQPKVSDHLTDRDVVRHTGKTNFRRGVEYLSDGRVLNARLSADGRTIESKVIGTLGQTYKQSIELTPSRAAGIEIAGNCSCPMRFNCKHVAAAVLFVMEESAEDATPEPPPPPPAEFELRPPDPPQRKRSAPVAAEPPLPFPITDWLREFAHHAGGNTYPTEINQRLLFIFHAANTGGLPQLTVELIEARILKDGTVSSATSRQSLSNFYGGNRPRYFRAIDVEIAQALKYTETLGSFGNGFPVRSPDVWKKIVSSGRGYWNTFQNPPLALGDPRPGKLEWILPDHTGLRPIVRIGGATALNADPPVYVDADQSTMGEIDLGLPPHFAHQLLNAPAIPASIVEKVSQRLEMFLPPASGVLPKPPEPPIPVNDQPRPVLRLMIAGDPNANHYPPIPNRMAVARLSFRYGPVSLNLGETSPIVETVRDNRRYAVRRGPLAEKDSLSKLVAAGMRFAREILWNIGPTHQSDLTFPDTTDWLTFLFREVPKLRAAGFEINIDDNFPFRIDQASGDLDVQLNQTRTIDWFELELGVELDGRRVDLAPLLAQFVLSGSITPADMQALIDEDGDLFLPTSEGSHLALAAKRFLPVIIALHDLSLGGNVLDKEGRVRISKAETSVLSVLDGQQGIVFEGAENVRKMARILSAAPGDFAPLALPDSFKATLRPYQEQGLAWLNLLREVSLGGILADDMGLGKTIQILALLAVEKSQGRLNKPALIVAPTSLMTNWQNEAKKFAPDLNVLLLHGASRRERFEHIESHDIVLTTYPLIARDQDILLKREWHMAILDEAQVIKNPNAATTKLIRDLKAAHRFCLTGTPMENHLGELWSLMTFANPGYLGEKTSFARRWRNPIEKHSDADRSHALARRVKPFMLRRTKQEVARELPPKTEVTEAIVLDEKQREVYDSIRLSMHKKVREAIAAKGLAKSHILILDALLKLRQVCCDPRLLPISSGPPAPSAKLQRLMEMIEELTAEKRKIIVFSQFTSMLALISARIEAAQIAYSLLTGETRDRAAAIEDFQSGKTNVFLISLKAGGVGLNLTAADTVILYDPWWNPAVEEQAIDRAYRIGQDKPVFVYRLVANQTIEEKMDELKTKKRNLANALFEQTGNPTGLLTEAELDGLFEA